MDCQLIKNPQYMEQLTYNSNIHLLKVYHHLFMFQMRMNLY